MDQLTRFLGRLASVSRFIYRHPSVLVGLLAKDIPRQAPLSEVDAISVEVKMLGRNQLLFMAFITLMLLQVNPVNAQTDNLMPQPAQLIPGSGRLVIDGNFRVALGGVREARLDAAAARLIKRLGQQTAIPISDVITSDSSQAALAIYCDHAGGIIQSVKEDESYQLEVTPKQARLTAPTPVGVMRGIETFLQLVDLDAQGFGLPAVRIVDRPRFPWRGLMIDVARHWMPPEVIRRNLDAMAAVKLNVLHLHLSDDQGFRLESKGYSKLQEMGSDGHYFTRAQITDLIAYARDRGIRVVPELDMPGHTTSWFVGYPELASGPGPYQIERQWGIFDPALDPTRDEIYNFLDGLIGEVAELFPDDYLHVCDDEVNGKQWDSNPRIAGFKRAHGLEDNTALQLYFNRRLLPIVQKHGKKMIGWDEIFHPDLPQDIVVHSWRGSDALAEAAKLGYMGILSHGYYLDYALSAADYYRVDPLEGKASALTPEQASRILGGETCMWSEFVTPENIDSRIWPSTAAIAERFWSPPEVKDVNSMYRRLQAVNRELDWVGITRDSSYALMLARLAGNQSPQALRTLADVVEPVKGYARPESRVYTSFTPLNRLVDAVRPESTEARIFEGMVEQLDSHKDAVRRQLTFWRDSRAALLPVLQQSALLQEDMPLAEDLSAVAGAGLEALDYLDTGKPAPAAWVKDQLLLLDLAAKPRAELLLKVVGPVQTLVEATQKGSH